MTNSADLRKRILDLPPKRLALLALELQEQLDRERSARSEPIAVVGMACRFPGGSDSPEAYWDLLEQGTDAIVEVPADRWSIDDLYDPDPDAPGKVATRWGGYLDDVQRFDAGFFSISPREARAMDPQQRLLLETCWRAFEDAGIPPARYFGSRAGVFVGVCNNDYLVRLLKEGAEAMDLYLSSGNAYSVAAGRLSFTLGFQGPALAVDTACSSSLVAIHTACQSLRSGESTLAVAAGVNVMCSAETSMALSRSHMMAPDGRCKTFDDAADGFVRAEGCGVLLLKRLSDAVRDGDRIHATIRASSINQDGRSTGLTVPNGPAQEQVLRDALSNAGLVPDDIDFIEAHGTGTSLGDPIEIRALGRVFGAERETPLYVGSVKTNFGHLESAAGVAGVIKAILAVRAGRIPPHLHFHTPSRHIEWDEYAIRVPAAGLAWPRDDRPRRAGVSSFGFSGTNAHVIVEQAPVTAPRKGDAPERGCELITLSGMTSGVIDGVVSAHADALAGLDSADFGDFAHSTRVGRTHFGYRRAVVARDASGAAAALSGAGGLTVFESPGRCVDAPDLVFLFTGQGAQHPGMGRSLYESAPAFRAAIDRCAEILDPLLEVPLTTVLFEDGGDDAPIYQTTLAQPAVVAFEYSLAELWRSWGVKPAAVLGHSLGEYVAATIAGVLRLEEMLPLVRERGRLLASLPSGQRMAAIFASAEVLAPMMASRPGCYVAAYNAPENTVISGDAAVVDSLLAACIERGIEHRVLRLEQAFHSPGVEPVMDALEAAASRVQYGVPRLPIAWNVTGEVGGAGASNAKYWRSHARESVRFTQGVQALAAQGFRHFLEVGPHPTLSPLVGQAVEDAIVIPSLRRGGDPWTDMLEAAAQLYVHGAEPEWAGIDAGFDRRRIPVPVHPFAGERYWVDGVEDLRTSAPRGAVPGIRVSTALPTFETVFTPGQPAFLDQHRFRGTPVVPGPLFAEMALRAGRAAGFAVDEVQDLAVRTAAFVPDDGLRLQTILDAGPESTGFRILSTPTGGSSETAVWTEHATGRLVTTATREAKAATEVGAEGADWTAVPVADHLARIRELGFELGMDAALYDGLEISGRHGRADLRQAAAGTAEPVAAALLLDAALQVLGAVVANRSTEPRMLTGIDRIEYFGDVLTATRCTVMVGESEGGVVRGEVRLVDASGRVVALASGVSLGRVSTALREVEGWFHRLEWRPIAEGPSFSASDLAGTAARLDREWSELAREAALPDYVAWLPDLRDRVAGHVWRGLVQRGMPASGRIPRTSLTPAALGIATRHARLLDRLLGLLVEAGILSREPDGFQVVAVPDPSRSAGPTPQGCEQIVALVDRCGESLAEVLQGSVDPVTLLFPDGGAEVTRSIYRSTPFGRAFNEAAREAVAGLVADRGADLPLRVIEVGAGSGSTTEAVRAALEGRPVDYTFTDVSPTLVGAAEAAMGGPAGLRFAVFDVEQDPLEQGFDGGSFDLVVAANVLHATDDLLAALNRTSALLRPGGTLLLLEGTRPEPWVDITFGLTDGWWRFRDTDLRADYPLLSIGRWKTALRQAGFTDVTSLPSDSLAADAGQVILVSRREETSGETESASAAMEGARIFDARERTDAATLLDEIHRAAEGGDEERLWIVTENAQAIGRDARPDPEAAALWGLGRTFSLEYPDRWGGLIDIEAGTSPEDAQRQIARAVGNPDEDQVAFRGGTRLCARLVQAEAPSESDLSLAGGSYIVTGGLGGLGLKVGRWLAGAGAARVVLVGRSIDTDRWEDDDPRRGALADLRETGIDLLLRSVDITDRDAVAALVDELAADGPPLRGVVHTAAVFDDAPLSELTPERYDRVMAPKALGAQNIADVTRDGMLDFLVFFSSTTALLGVAGLGSYAAANLHLDALAASLRTTGVPAISVNWGLWEEMRLAGEEDATRYAQSGLRTMNSDDALGALRRAIVDGQPNTVIASVDWERLRTVYEGRRRRPLLAELGRTSEVASTTDAISGDRSLFEEISQLPGDARRPAIVAAVEDELRAVLRLTTGSLDSERGFFEMGLDSLMSVELKTRLEKRFGTRLPATLTFNYPTVAAVAEYLHGRIDAAVEESVAAAPSSVEGGSLAPEPQGVAAVAEAAELEGGGDADDGDDLSADRLAAMLEERLSRLDLGGGG